MTQRTAMAAQRPKAERQTNQVEDADADADADAKNTQARVQRAFPEERVPLPPFIFFFQVKAVHVPQGLGPMRICGW